MGSNLSADGLHSNPILWPVDAQEHCVQSLNPNGLGLGGQDLV